MIDDGNIKPTGFQIAPAGEVIFTLHFDGRIEIDDKYTVTEAAKAFWDEVRKGQPDGAQLERARDEVERLRARVAALEAGSNSDGDRLTEYTRHIAKVEAERDEAQRLAVELVDLAGEAGDDWDVARQWEGINRLGDTIERYRKELADG